MKQGTVGTYGSESLPNIKGEIYEGVLQAAVGFGIGSGFQSGALQGRLKRTGVTYPGDSGAVANANDGFAFDASLSSSTYQNNAKVNPDNAEILYCIKY